MVRVCRRDLPLNGFVIVEDSELLERAGIKADRERDLSATNWPPSIETFMQALSVGFGLKSDIMARWV